MTAIYGEYWCSHTVISVTVLLSKKQYLIISSAILQYFIAAYFFEVIPQLKHFYPQVRCNTWI
nr:MAG TPA: hypothetical protein [Caudoviricetes sp.]